MDLPIETWQKKKKPSEKSNSRKFLIYNIVFLDVGEPRRNKKFVAKEHFSFLRVFLSFKSHKYLFLWKMQ